MFIAWSNNDGDNKEPTNDDCAVGYKNNPVALRNASWGPLDLDMIYTRFL